VGIIFSPIFLPEDVMGKSEMLEMGTKRKKSHKPKESER